MPATIPDDFTMKILLILSMNLKTALSRYVILVTGFLSISFLSIGEPMVSDEAYMEGWCNTSVGSYIKYASTNYNPYFSIEGDTYTVPLLEVDIGIGERVNFEILWPAYILAEGRKGKSTDSWGDARLSTEIGLLKETSTRPASAFRIGIKMPNTSDESGLGTDEPDICGYLLLSKSYSDINVHTNLGVKIISDPFSKRNQYDVFLYRVAVERSFVEKLR